MKRFILFGTALLLAVASVASISTTYVSAADESSSGASCDEQFYAANDVLFYNPCATTCSASGGASGVGTISQLRGNNNAEKIFNYWLDAGMSAQQAAGISGSMKHEGGFSPFRQEMSQSWPGGGWGIAQFTHDPGQRGEAKKYVSAAIGAELFNQYYKPEYGGGVVESNGFVPKGVPQDVNDKFLLAQLNYLLEHIKGLKPNNVRTTLLKNHYSQTIASGTSLYDHLKTLVQAGDSAIAWTYLYEFPGDIKATAQVRANSAADILTLYANGTGAGISTACGGGLVAGGMTLEQAKKFVEDYKNSADSVNYIGGSGRDCAGGPLSNCVSFSTYFINKYTTAKGFTDQAPGNGSTVATNVIARNPGIGNGHSPQPYAIFSTPSGSEMCGSVKCGHTGVILGVDTARGKVIVGEAACGSGSDWDTAREYDLSKFDSDSYTYAYMNSLLKGDVK